jgi:hypothetical protein
MASAAVTVLFPWATVGSLSPILIAISLGGLIVAGPQLTAAEVTPLTVTAWSASAVAALALSAVALSLLRIDLSLPAIGIAYLLWIPTVAFAYLVLAGAGRQNRSTGSGAEPPVPSTRSRLRVWDWLAYVGAAVLPAAIVVVLLLTAPSREGPTLSVWILPATGGVAGNVTVRPGEAYDVIGGVQAERAGDRRVDLVIDLAGVEAMRRSFAASETPAPFSSAIAVPLDASGSVPVFARARFAGDPSSEVTAVLRLNVSR